MLASLYSLLCIVSWQCSGLPDWRFTLHTDLISQSRWKSVNVVDEGKTACIIRLSNCCCNIVAGQKRNELFWIGFLVLILLFLNYMCINQNGDGTD